MPRGRGGSSGLDQWVRQLGERIGRELGQVIAEGMRQTLAKSVESTELVRHLGGNGKKSRSAAAGKSSCTMPGCDDPVLAKGLCRSHYYRARYQAQKAGTLQRRR